MLFESLQSDKRKPELKTINDMFEKNFTFCSGAHLQYLRNDKRFNNAIVEDFTVDMILECVDAVAEPANKIAILDASATFLKLQNTLYRSGVSSIKILKEKVGIFY